MTTIKLRRGTAAQWTTVNPILAQGEPGFETDTGKHKIGNGITNWAGLKYYVDEVDLSNAVSGEVSARNTAINTAVSNLINGAPTALDTLLELSSQLASDESAVGALVSSISSHVADHNNPHVVTKAQVGLSDVPNVNTTAAIATALTAVQFVDFDPDGVPFIETGVTPSLDIDTAVSNYIGAPGGPSQIDAKLATSYIPSWKPLTAYGVGAIVMAPDGSIVKRLTSGTSGTTYSSTNWQTVATVSGTQANTELNNAYARAISVTDSRFGAVGDGTTNDTAAIAAAKSAALSAGRPLYFPKGTYLHTGFDVAGLMVLGDGKGKTIIRSTGANHALSVIGTSVSHTTADIRNLTLDAPSGSAGQCCFHADYADDLFVQDVEMSGGWINGCEIFTSARVRLSRLDVHGARTFGTFFYQCQDSTIEFSRIHDITTSGRSHLGIQFKASQRCSAIRNRIENINGYGIYTWTDGSLADTDHRITDNIISGLRSDGSGFAGLGIFLSTGSGHETTFNQVYDTESSAISVTGCTDFLVHANRARASYGAETAAISVAGSSSDFAVTNNRVTGYSQGYYFDTVSQGRIVQNRARNLRASVSSLSAAYHFKTSTSLRVEGNGFLDDQGTPTSQRGFYEEATCSNNVYLSNRSKGSLVGDWALVGTNSTQGLNTIIDDTQTTIVTTYVIAGVYTWTPVAGCKVVHATAVGGGGGGGSGRRGAAASIRNGGGSGSGAGFSELMVPASVFGTSQTVTVGAGGTGGAAVTTDDTNGNPGTDGATSSFGALVVGGPGRGGQGGTASALTAASAGLGRFSGATGAIPSATGGNGAGANASVGGAPSGGAGGGITNAGGAGDVEGTGGAGGSSPGRNASNATAGAIATAGGNGISVTTPQPGYSGAGGGASKTTAAGAGGNGGTYGTGGGGGGASLNGNNSGKGGDAGAGTVVIIQFF